jgi:GH15 family glucan-1,4-alpha-glucosidase
MSLRIEDYALLGDCRAAALVGKDGSIDWLCLPHFDSAACFAALLGSRDNGRWQIAPAGKVTAVSRRYRDGTLILETDFETDEGAVTLIDLMPLRRQVPDLLRVVVGRRGTVSMHMELLVRFDYGSIVPWVQRIPGGIEAIGGPDRLRLTTPVETHGENLHTVADFQVREGERIPFHLTWTPSHRPAVDPIPPETAIAETEQDWRAWSSRFPCEGPHAGLVQRSLLTLKALTYAPTGGIVAAATTSLPERIGGGRNWDYRFCWLRDATLTLYALMSAGYKDEALAWRDWLLRAVAGDPSRVQILYGLHGQRRLPEAALPWLAGYEGSFPARVGNAASEQLQLDVYGEVMAALFVAQQRGLASQQPSWALQTKMMQFLETAWDQPDEGIWEIRGPRRQFTHSKVMAWLAFDCAVKSIEQFGLPGPLERWRGIRDQIHASICARGFDPQLGSFVQTYDRQELDASLLMIPLVGFLPATDPRMLGTVAAIERHLMFDGLVVRYRTESKVDGLPSGEGAFLPCTFWLVDNYALQGRIADARALFDRLAALCNDVGLLSEEYDPADRRMLGNFPQAFTHVALVNSALTLARLASAPAGSDGPGLPGATAR